MPAKTRTNLFTLLLIPTGLVFVITAVAYGYMAFIDVNGAPGDAARNAGHPLFQWLRVHGDGALIGELIALALVTVGVIASDKVESQDARESRESARIQIGRDAASTHAQSSPIRDHSRDSRATPN